MVSFSRSKRKFRMIGHACEIIPSKATVTVKAQGPDATTGPATTLGSLASGKK